MLRRVGWLGAAAGGGHADTRALFCTVDSALSDRNCCNGGAYVLLADTSSTKETDVYACSFVGYGVKRYARRYRRNPRIQQ